MFTSLIYGLTFIMTNMVTTGDLWFVTPRSHIYPRDTIELVQSTVERCLVTQTSQVPLYSVSPPATVRTFTSDTETNIMTNAIGWIMYRDILTNLDLSISNVTPYYIDTSTTYNAGNRIGMMTFAGLSDWSYRPTTNLFMERYSDLYELQRTAPPPTQSWVEYWYSSASSTTMQRAIELAAAAYRFNTSGVLDLEFVQENVNSYIQTYDLVSTQFVYQTNLIVTSANNFFLTNLTAYLDPNGDSTPLEWTPTPSGSHYTTIDDGVRSPNLPDFSDYIREANTNSFSLTDTFEMSTMNDINEVTNITVSIYVGISDGDGNMGVSVSLSGVTQYLLLVPTPPDWYSFSWTGSWNQSDIDAMTLEFEANQPSNPDEPSTSTVYAAYAEINYLGEVPNPIDPSGIYTPISDVDGFDAWSGPSSWIAQVNTNDVTNYYITTDVNTYEPAWSRPDSVPTGTYATTHGTAAGTLSVVYQIVRTGTNFFYETNRHYECTFRKTAANYDVPTYTNIEHQVIYWTYATRRTEGASNYYYDQGLGIPETNWHNFGTHTWSFEYTNPVSIGSYGSLNILPQLAPDATEQPFSTNGVTHRIYRGFLLDTFGSDNDWRFNYATSVP